MDVEGILGFAARVLPRAADCGCRPRSNSASALFFPDEIAFDGKEFVRTAVTAPASNTLQPAEPAAGHVEEHVAIRLEGHLSYECPRV
jgi:hypothetical protein